MLPGSDWLAGEKKSTLKMSRIFSRFMLVSGSEDPASSRCRKERVSREGKEGRRSRFILLADERGQTYTKLKMYSGLVVFTRI